jgi:hypothetical protein
MAWEQLSAMRQERIQQAEYEASTPPTACWLCGTPLEAAPDGGLFCRADGWRPDDMAGELRS